MFFYGCPYTMCTVQYNISMFLLLIYSHWSASPRTIASFPFASDKYVDLSKASASQVNSYGGAKAIRFFPHCIWADSKHQQIKVDLSTYLYQLSHHIPVPESTS